MGRIIKHIAFIFLAFISFNAISQISETPAQLEAVIESIIEELDEETDATLILEDLEKYAENPLNFNTASHEQLSRLHLLDDIQIQKLIDYRNKFGAVLSIFELNVIDGISRDELIEMEPFIWFGPVGENERDISTKIKYAENEFLIRSLGTLQKPDGYKKRDDFSIPFEGNRARYFARYRFVADDFISAGITAEKDPGESFFLDSNKKGFDFYSGHLSIKISPVIENVTIGDFVVRSGQGLVLWQGYSTRKSVFTQNISKTNQGSRPYTSTDENRFFRGISTTFHMGSARLNLFYSQKKSDGNRGFSEPVGDYFSSIQTSGYHRTESEIADKNSVRDLNTGAIGTLRFRNLKIGTTILYRQFEFPLLLPNQLYNQFRFQGKENFVLSTDYLYSKGKYQFFGEAAVSKSKGKAVVQGATAHLHDRLQLSALFRHFDRNYHALWATPFAEGSSAINETGMYFGTRILPVKFVSLSLYSDIYRSEWINFSTAGPSRGWDFFVQADIVPSADFQGYIRFKNEEKEQKFGINEKYENRPERFQKSRIHIQYHASETIILKTRLEHVLYKGIETANGVMVFQDLQFIPSEIPLNCVLRLAWFHTDGYNSRIYAYENDLLYTFSIPAYFGKGFRAYFNIKYKISEKAEVWFKLANSMMNNVESISSGYNEITGNNKTEVKIQIRLKI